MFHPAVATYNLNKLDILKEDFKILKNELNNFSNNLEK